jgi:hypothetical protein
MRPDRQTRNATPTKKRRISLMARCIVSGRATGNARERAFESRLWKHGYRTARFTGSGQRISAKHQEGGICGDMIALAPEHSGLPHLVAEIGGTGKRLGTAFAALTARPLLGGFVPVVARCVARSWIYYTAPGSRHNHFSAFIDALKDGGIS